MITAIIRKISEKFSSASESTKEEGVRMVADCASEPVLRTNLPLPCLGRGKVRDIYEIGQDKLLIVTTDRLSAFDVVLPNPIPFKGRVLNQISAFWFEFFQDLVPHHLITLDVEKMGLDAKIVDQFGALLKGRSMLVRRARPMPVECVARGYVAGSGWKDYQRSGRICGHELPAGLRQCEQLPQPIFTPSTKATEGHDENIDREKAAQLVGDDTAVRLEELTLEVYRRGAEYARKKGIIIADTKFEFGELDGELILIDEVLTPDSSRFWPLDRYEVGRDQPSYDKQIIRNYLEETGWNKRPPAPKLPEHVVEKTSQAYLDVFQRLTGRKLS